MQLLPLGDQGFLTYCEDEAAAFALAANVRHRHLPWILDVVQAYKSVAFFVDQRQIEFAEAGRILEEAEATTPSAAGDAESRLHIVPCCYEMGLDLQRVADATRLSVDEVIRLHSEQVYTVYAIGFCPGFPYLGYLPNALRGVPRLETPRVKVDVGSVGLTGKQTGIYTEAEPGGWNIVGRTPLQLVDVADGYFPLRTGDRVQFRRIDAKEFGELGGKRVT